MHLSQMNTGKNVCICHAIDYMIITVCLVMFCYFVRNLKVRKNSLVAYPGAESAMLYRCYYYGAKFSCSLSVVLICSLSSKMFTVHNKHRTGRISCGACELLIIIIIKPFKYNCTSA